MSNRKNEQKHNKGNSQGKSSLNEKKQPDFNQTLRDELELSGQSIELISSENNNQIKKNLLKDSLSIIENTFKKRITFDFMLQIKSNSTTDPLIILEMLTTFSENKELLEELGNYLHNRQDSFKDPLMLLLKNNSTEVNLTSEIREISFALTRKKIE